MALLVAVLLSGPGEARACKLIPPQMHVTNPSLRASDSQAPALAGPPTVEIVRGKGPEGTGCGGATATSCDDLGRVTITVAASDDRTPAPELGFRVVVKSGNPPPDFALPSGDILATDGKIFLHWVDGATNDHERISFVLAIAPVDAAGNVGASMDLPIADGEGGCALGGGGRPRLLLPLLLAVLWAGLRRRR